MNEKADVVQLVKLLLDISLFESLDYTQISRILEVCTRRNVKPGEVLCESRTIDEALFILLSGALRLESAEEKMLTELRPVRVLGEMGVFTGQHRSSRVVGLEPAVVLELAEADLGMLFDEDPQMANHMMGSLVKLLYGRLHEINEELEMVQEQAHRLRGRLKEVVPDDPLLDELFPDSSYDASE